jgi:hypothetical protein
VTQERDPIEGWQWRRWSPIFKRAVGVIIVKTAPQIEPSTGPPEGPLPKNPIPNPIKKDTGTGM